MPCCSRGSPWPIHLLGGRSIAWIRPRLETYSPSPRANFAQPQPLWRLASSLVNVYTNNSLLASTPSAPASCAHFHHVCDDQCPRAPALRRGFFTSHHVGSTRRRGRSNWPFRAANSPVVGDPRLGVRVRLVGEATQSISFQLGAYAYLGFLGLNNRTQNVTDEGFRGKIFATAAGRISVLRWALTLGYHGRPGLHTSSSTWAVSSMSTQVLWSVLLNDMLFAGLETTLSTEVEKAFRQGPELVGEAFRACSSSKGSCNLALPAALASPKPSEHPQAEPCSPSRFALEFPGLPVRPPLGARARKATTTPTTPTTPTAPARKSRVRPTRRTLADCGRAAVATRVRVH